MKLPHFALAALCTLTLAGAASAATVTNGSFENPGTFSGNWQTLGAGSTALDGWTIGGAGIDHINTGWSASQGGYSIDLNAGGLGTISQTITGLVVGQTYNLTFDMAGNSARGPAIKSLTASVGTAASQIFTFDTTGQSFSDPDWEGRRLTFVANEETALLTFASNQNNAYGAALDNIMLNPVPLPAGAVLLASGVGALTLRRRAKG